MQYANSEIIILFYVFIQLSRMTGIDLATSFLNFFLREGPGKTQGSLVSRLGENWCQSTAMTKMSLFLI